MKRSSGEKAPVDNSSRSQTERSVNCREGSRLAYALRSSSAAAGMAKSTSWPPNGAISRAIFNLLGYLFAPRIRVIGGQQRSRMDHTVNSPHDEPLPGPQACPHPGALARPLAAA